MLTTNQKQILENLRLFEIEKAERMKSFSYRMKFYWYKFKKWITFQN
jgi:hypothetical protein